MTSGSAGGPQPAALPLFAQSPLLAPERGRSGRGSGGVAVQGKHRRCKDPPQPKQCLAIRWFLFFQAINLFRSCFIWDFLPSLLGQGQAVGQTGAELAPGKKKKESESGH